MKKILNIIVLFVLIVSAFGSAINIHSIIKSRSYHKTEAKITFIGLPDGTVYGNFVDAKGILHIDAYLYTDIKFTEFFSIKKTSSQKIDKHIGKKISILFDARTNTIINYENMVKNTILYNIVLMISCIVFFIIRKWKRLN